MQMSVFRSSWKACVMKKLCMDPHTVRSTEYFSTLLNHAVRHRTRKITLQAQFISHLLIINISFLSLALFPLFPEKETTILLLFTVWSLKHRSLSPRVQFCLLYKNLSSFIRYVIFCLGSSVLVSVCGIHSDQSMQLILYCNNVSKSGCGPLPLHYNT